MGNESIRVADDDKIAGDCIEGPLEIEGFTLASGWVRRYAGIKKLHHVQQGDGMNILVVDGEEGARIVFLNTLFRRGYQATFAKSGEDALDHLGKGSFDLVITDSKLPAMDGLLLLDEIKKRSPKVDVIMVTDSGSIENYLKAVSLGVDEYIGKPFRMRDLKWIINAFLARRKRNVLDQFGSEAHLEHENDWTTSSYS